MFLIIGGDSEIGVAAHRAMRSKGLRVAATTRRAGQTAGDRPLLDLAKPLDGWEPPPGSRAACICAGIARLSACALDPEGSAHINVDQTLVLIEKMLARNIYVLFLSSNQVFDGCAPQLMADAPGVPLSEYGRQKARTEFALRRLMAAGGPVAILRLGKVVSPAMPLISGWVADLSAGKPIRAYNDLKLAPVPIDMVTTAIGFLLQDRAAGLFQLTGPLDVTYADVGRFLARYLGADPTLVKEESARTAGLPEGSTPTHTTLDSSALRARYGLHVPNVWTIVEQIARTARSGAVLPIAP